MRRGGLTQFLKDALSVEVSGDDMFKATPDADLRCYEGTIWLKDGRAVIVSHDYEWDLTRYFIRGHKFQVIDIRLPEELK